ncbi:ferric-dicitrate binding protein FerR (iron transport regulator) [Prolixibacter denitrificans]|uniref:Anti-sigma factor n=2 Tax=Prolixibacter denitrificans TaxID=1541063 RepID=A0A2P8C826_9BACT|nr:ferric-dicitrate binding protein FerR (iron transport regulator) [Prolixibacter denitrificans]GET22240.1 anti-sigma factor [Prolixibacter denitrificans]
MEPIPMHLIIQSFESGLSEKEQQELDTWLAASDENRQQYEELRKTYVAGGKLNIDFEPDARKALAKVHRRIHSKKVIRFTWRVTAAVIFLALVTQVVLQTQSTANWNEVIAQQRQTVYLPDSSKVILAKNAYLSYPSTFTKNERDVRLSGTAYFEVTHHPERPFRIKTADAQIKVLGTKFLVKSGLKNTESVSVDEGRVAFRTGSLFARHKVILTKNEIGIWNAKDHQLTEQDNPNPNSNAWISGRLSFTSAPLSDVLKTLEDHFKISVELADENFADLKYSGQFNDLEGAQKIIQTICLTLNLSYQQQTNHFILTP